MSISLEAGADRYDRIAFIVVVEVLDNVLNHYGNGIQNSATLDPLLKNKISLTTEERYYIKTFLATLTDSTLLTDKRFDQPQ